MRALALSVLLPVAACGKGAPTPQAKPPHEELEAVLSPAAAVAALRRIGGGHVRALTAFRVRPRQPPPGYVPARDAITTATDVWMDPKGFYRLLEENDQDGGREVIHTDKQIAVALRYGKLIERPAREPEPTRYLEEALGGPYAAWELARRFAEVSRSGEGGAEVVYKLTRATKPRPLGPGSPPLSRWRDGADVTALHGEIRVDRKTNAVVGAKINARFSVTRDEAPLEGEASAELTLAEVGKIPPTPKPEAESLRPRQRTILEERALLGKAPESAPERTP